MGIDFHILRNKTEERTRALCTCVSVAEEFLAARKASIENRQKVSRVLTEAERTKLWIRDGV